MRTRYGISIAWMAAAFVLFGAAFGFAQTGSKHSTGPSPKSTSHVDANENDQGDEVADETADTNSSQSSDHERKQNHGFFVSTAAHCENVDEASTPASPDFTAPPNCKDDGKAHGDYVRSVAKSDLGKSNQGHKP
jgi:hypothetical protein